MANGIIKSFQAWTRILIVGFFVINLIGCDSNNFPKSWAEFKAFNPFDAKSGAERAVLRHFETHSKRQDGNMQFISSIPAKFGEQADFWEIRNFNIGISLVEISEADRLNGIEDHATFNVTCSAYRTRAFYPKESKEWSLWQEGGELLKGEAVKRNGVWSVQFTRNTSMGGAVQVSIENLEQFEKRGKERLAADGGEGGTNRYRLPRKLVAMIEPYTEARFFDSHTHVFEGSYETVWQAVESILKSRKDKVIASDQTAGTLVTDLSRHGILGFPTHDKFFIYLESVDSNHTRIEFVLFSLGPNNESYLVPITDKEFVAKRAQKFLDLVEASLKPKT